MIILFQFLLALALLFLATMIFMAVRQIGILSRRIPRNEDLADNKPHSLIGEKAPTLEFKDTAHAGLLTIPLDGSGHSFLLFTSFTCSICHPMLEQLHRLPIALRQKLLLMVLSESPRELFAREVQTFQLGEFSMTDATGYSEAFKLRHAPALYVLDAGGVVQEVLQIWSYSDLLDHLTRITTQAPHAKTQHKEIAEEKQVQAVGV